ncbi:FxsA family protein [Nocardioides limicola]|uniref:FxsA family protein n=1 Tax=Nocardioides limicola TaxID=2803368 RepID=UPI00193B08FF|nr:FxsA family protein [Nocardioides sp. DJM-14]
MPTRRRSLLWPLAVAFVVMPLVEVFVLIQVGRMIGVGWTLLALIAVSVVGAWLVKREGVRAWRQLVDAFAAGRVPAREIADGALILIGATLMLTPGFVTDALGALLILPVTRPLFRRMLTALVGQRIVLAMVPPDPVRGYGDPRPGGSMPGGSMPGGTMPGDVVPGDVVPGDVVDDDDR